MTFLEITAWLLLLSSSILALAGLFAAMQAKLNRRSEKRSAGQNEAECCFGNLQQLAGALDRMSRDQVSDQLRNLQRHVHEFRRTNGLAAVLHFLLETMPNDAQTILNGVRGIISAEQRRLERGGQRLCGFLIKLGPWAGLMGTLVGVRASLAAFVNNLTAINEFAAGFATAIDTTIFGILIAVVSFSTTKWIWVPLLEDVSCELAEHGTVAFACINRIRGYLDDGDSASQLARVPKSSPDTPPTTSADNIELAPRANKGPIACSTPIPT